MMRTISARSKANTLEIAIWSVDQWYASDDGISSAAIRDITGTLTDLRAAKIACTV